MINITIRQLEAFVATAEYESFTKAAEILHLTQSTVSIHVKSMEKILGMRLITRGSRARLVLTEDGKQVYAAAKDILSRGEALEQMRFGPKEDTLSVAASTVPAVSLMPNLVNGFIRRRGGTKYMLKRGDSEHVLKLLSRGDARIGFVGMEPNSRLFKSRAIEDDTLVLIAANNPEYRDLQKREIFAEDLLFRPMVCREEGSATQRLVDTYLRKIGFSRENLNIIACVDNPETVIGMAADGTGVAIISTVAAESALKAGSVLAFPFRDGGLKRHIYIVWKRDITLTQTENAFLRYALNTCRETR